MERRRMDVQDALWLTMDRPTNLMVVDSVMWTADPIDWKCFEHVIRLRLWERYRVFRSLAVRGADDAWYWEERSDLDLTRQLSRVVLPGPGGDAELQQFIASQRTVALDRTRPLWHVFCVDGHGNGSAVVARTHHALADGIRMVQVAMSLLDASPEGGAILAPAVRLHAASERPQGARQPRSLRARAAPVAEELVELALDAADHVRHVVGDPVGTARNGLGALIGAVGHGAASAVGTTVEVAAMALVNPVGAAHTTATCAVDMVGSTVALLRAAFRPRLPGSGPLVDLLSAAPGDADIARKLLLGTRNDATCWTGTVGTRKAVAWSAPLALTRVKEVARAHDVTVNDVLTACVAGSLHTYLVAHDCKCASVAMMIPVNLKALDVTLPEELGNSFAIVQLELPTDTSDPLAVLDMVKGRMRRIKNGHEAAVAFRVQELVAGLGTRVYRAAVDLLANRAVGVLTNVPGPPMTVYLAGQRVEGMVGWAPLSGNQPMSFTVYSYDGKVFVGIACDAGLVPDHHQIVDGFTDAFDRLAIAHR
jgi:diacylglycerol O-acyltransferase